MRSDDVMFYVSLQLSLRCLIHMELAKCEEDVDHLKVAEEHVRKVCLYSFIYPFIHLFIFLIYSFTYSAILTEGWHLVIAILFVSFSMSYLSPA